MPRLRLWAVWFISAILVLATFIIGAFAMHEITHGKWYYYPIFLVTALGFTILATLVNKLETTSMAPRGVLVMASLMLAGNTFTISLFKVFSGLDLLVKSILSGVFAVLSLYLLLMPLMSIFPNTPKLAENDRFVYVEHEKLYDDWWTTDKLPGRIAVDNPFTSSMQISSYYNPLDTMRETMDFVVREYYYRDLDKNDGSCCL